MRYKRFFIKKDIHTAADAIDFVNDIRFVILKSKSTYIVWRNKAFEKYDILPIYGINYEKLYSAFCPNLYQKDTFVFRFNYDESLDDKRKVLAIQSHYINVFKNDIFILYEK